MKNISTMEILPEGTEVYSLGKKGKVISHSISRDQFNQPIVVHTIRFYEQYSHKAPGEKGIKSIFKPIDKTMPVNYSAILIHK